jgi:pSer/pThr/pTyr-binding forkhead associated (FHA) protein
MWKLAIEDDEGNRTLVPLTRELYTIGRRDGNTIRLTERNVSRDHAKLSKRNGVPSEKATFVLEDLTSYNGVFVNGLRITHAQDLTQGDLVQIGDYRIVLQDEVQADAAAPASAASATPTAIDEAKVTIPGAPYARVASAAFDRPNRLVMIVGPAPGSEFPMDRELLTIGRAEDATISVNHNSVSRMHCEVRALGEGRFEIVDNASSNGVRVNGTELRRGIVEPGDLIELGDVRFKFVAAGKMFRPTDSQQFELLSDTTATDVVRPRHRGTTLPIAIFAAVIVAGGLGAWMHSRWRGEGQTTSAAPVARGPSPDQSAIEDAKKACFVGDCELAHAGLEATIAESSPLRTTPDFKDVENRWADQVLARADAEADVTKKRSLYQRVSQSVSADPGRRKIAADKLQQLDTSANTLGTNPTQLPVAFEMPAQNEPPAPSPRAEPTRKPQREVEATALAAPAAPSPPPVSTPSTTKSAGVDDRERQLALQGTQDSKVLLKQQLEPRVFGGKASDTEIRLLISTCKDLGDKTCVQQARAVWSQKQGN